PFTYQFAADASPNMTTYAWNFGDGTTSTAQNPPLKTYAAPGTYTITLACTPSTGSTINLSGVINITPAVSAGFYFADGTSLVGMPPFNISAVNTSGGVGLEYAWKVSTSSNPADAGLPGLTATTLNYSPT